MPIGAQHAGGQRDLCAGQVPAVDPAHPALQRGTESRRQRLRQRAWLSGSDGRRKNRLKLGRLRSKCRVCTRCFDRQSPQAYSVSIPRLWAQMCGYGAGETGKHRSCGGSQLRRCGSTEGSQPFVPGCRGGSALLGSRGNAHWQVKGGSHYRVKGETPCPGRVDACVNSYWVLPDAKFAGFAASPPLPRPQNIFAGRRKSV